MFSAMLSGLSGSSDQGQTRSLLDCAAQAGHNQARNFGLASLNTSNTGEEVIVDEMSDDDDVSGPLSALHSMTDMKTAAMLSQVSKTSPAVSPGSPPAPVSPVTSPSPPPGSAPGSTATPTTPHTVNPHGIDSILNRSRTAAGLSAMGLSGAVSSANNVGDQLSR